MSHPHPFRVLLQLALLLGLAAPGTFPPAARAQSVDASLDNGVVRIGVSRAQGGAITWLSTHGGSNLVNNHDQGRQIQQSYYAGANRRATNQCPSWSPWPWNPIMVGDCGGAASPVLALTQTNQELYIKSQPLLWDRRNQLSQSFIELWIRFHPSVSNLVVVDNRFTCFRDPQDEWGGPVDRPQEIPACYFVTRLHTIKSYTGPAPWQNQPLDRIPAVFMWTNFVATEQWAACVDSSDFGVAVFSPEATRMNAGQAGREITSNPLAASTMHLAPLVNRAFAHNSVFEYRCYLGVGPLADLRRAFAQIHAHPESVPRRRDRSP